MANIETKDINRSNIRQEYATKAILTLIFFTILFAFIWWAWSTGKELEAFHLSVFEMALIGFATVRLGRLIAYSHVMEPIRAPFTVTVPDETGAGENVEGAWNGSPLCHRSVDQLSNLCGHLVRGFFGLRAVYHTGSNSHFFVYDRFYRNRRDIERAG